MWYKRNVENFEKLIKNPANNPTNPICENNLLCLVNFSKKKSVVQALENKLIKRLQFFFVDIY